MFTPDQGTAAWVLAGALSICPLIFLPTIGFFISREFSRMDANNKNNAEQFEQTKNLIFAQNEETRKMVIAVEKLAHETQMMVRDLREWVGDNFIKRPEYNNDRQTTIEMIRGVNKRIPSDGN